MACPVQLGLGVREHKSTARTTNSAIEYGAGNVVMGRPVTPRRHMQKNQVSAVDNMSGQTGDVTERAVKTYVVVATFARSIIVQATDMLHALDQADRQHDITS